MTRRARNAWAILGASALAVGLALAYLAGIALELERREVSARADNENYAAVRLALWRMDSWLGPQLAREAMRPYQEYFAFYPQSRPARVFPDLEAGEVLKPSPLLGTQQPLFPLHFQVDAHGQITSPQAPATNPRDLTESSLVTPATLDRHQAMLRDLAGFVTRAALSAKVGAGEALLPPLGCSVVAPIQQGQGQLDGMVQNVQEYQTRANISKHQWNSQPQQSEAAGATVITGPLLPVWLEDGQGQPRLVFARRVRMRGETLFQGVLADWDKLRAELLEQSKDLFPPALATLVRNDAPTPEQQGAMLATVPALLAVTRPPPVQSFLTPMRGVLAAAVLAMLLALVGVAATLRSALQFGERRSRFASAVTHELRTPLTTFRMYSEMLATGVVTEESRRREYLETLQREADRLARLVENVLGYARLEEGRYRGRRERVTAGELVTRASDPLAQRAAQAAMALVVDHRAEHTRLDVDVDAVTQILFNLVDNACKYAVHSDPRAIRLEVAEAGGQLTVRVRDFGPGVPAAYRARIFEPFDRGGRETAESQTPGVGLGLALARGLARELGGELELEPSDRGAVFALRLPAA